MNYRVVTVSSKPEKCNDPDVYENNKEFPELIKYCIESEDMTFVLTYEEQESDSRGCWEEDKEGYLYVWYHVNEFFYQVNIKSFETE